jgi:hypothetical protein
MCPVLFGASIRLTPSGLARKSATGGFVVARRAEPVEVVPALQGARSPLRPTVFSVYAYLMCCSRLPAQQ